MLCPYTPMPLNPVNYGRTHSCFCSLPYFSCPLPKKRAPQEGQKYKSPQCQKIPPRRHRPMLLLIIILNPADLAPRLKGCSSMPLTLPTVVLSTIGASSTQRRHLLCPTLMTRGLNAASLMHRLLFGACQRCAQGSSRRVIAFSIPLTYSCWHYQFGAHE